MSDVGMDCYIIDDSYFIIYCVHIIVVMLPEKPIQLIHPDPNHHRNLEIISSNVKHLHQIHTAVAVVAVVGKFHSGKSFLLNQLMGKQNGFGVGPSVRPETMGIWMWGKVRSLYIHS